MRKKCECFVFQSWVMLDEAEDQNVARFWVS